MVPRSSVPESYPGSTKRWILKICQEVSRMKFFRSLTFPKVVLTCLGTVRNLLALSLVIFGCSMSRGEALTRPWHDRICQIWSNLGFSGKGFTFEQIEGQTGTGISNNIVLFYFVLFFNCRGEYVTTFEYNNTLCCNNYSYFRMNNNSAWCTHSFLTVFTLIWCHPQRGTLILFSPFLH